MKVIVNRKQYNSVINEARGYSKVVENWADFITDEMLLKILKQDVDMYIESDSDMIAIESKVFLQQER